MRNVRHIAYRVAAAIMAAAALTACHDEAAGSLMPDAPQGSVRFAPTTAGRQQGATRAAVLNANPFTDGTYNEFKAWGFAASAPNTEILADKQVVTKDNGWNSLQEWPLTGGDLRFYACAPNDAITTAPTYSDKPVLSYKGPWGDLLYAESAEDTYTSGTCKTVAMPFSHVCAGIHFEVGTFTTSYFPQKITIKSVPYTSGTYTPGSGWAGNEYYGKDTDVTELYCNDYIYSFLPQTHGALTIEVDIWQGIDAYTNVYKWTATGTIPAGTWERGKAYTYTISYEKTDDKNIILNCYEEDWEDVEGEIEVVDPVSSLGLEIGTWNGRFCGFTNDKTMADEYFGESGKMKAGSTVAVSFKAVNNDWGIGICCGKDGSSFRDTGQYAHSEMVSGDTVWTLYFELTASDVTNIYNAIKNQPNEEESRIIVFSFTNQYGIALESIELIP